MAHSRGNDTLEYELALRACGGDRAAVAELADRVRLRLFALAYAELGAMMPETGGQYVYLREAYGPLLAFLCGWTYFFVVLSGAIASGDAKGNADEAENERIVIAQTSW